MITQTENSAADIIEWLEETGMALDYRTMVNLALEGVDAGLAKEDITDLLIFSGAKEGRPTVDKQEKFIAAYRGYVCELLPALEAASASPPQPNKPKKNLIQKIKSSTKPSNSHLGKRRPPFPVV